MQSRQSTCQRSHKGQGSNPEPRAHRPVLWAPLTAGREAAPSSPQILTEALRRGLD